MYSEVYLLKQLSRPTMIGIVLVVIGIILFVIVWGILGQTAMQFLPRLALSTCLPPGVIALLAGIYILVVPPKV
jgi:hypothetical protein